MTQKIGIIGGAGPLASALLYKKCVEYAYQTNASKPNEIPPMVIINYPFSFDILKNPEAATRALQECIDTLHASKCTLVIMACNSLHAFMKNRELHGMRFITLMQVVEMQTVKRAKKVLILATSTTIEQKLYSNSRVEWILPSHDERTQVTGIILRVLSGKVERSDAERLNAMIARYHKEQNIDSALLGCTELSVLHDTYAVGQKSVQSIDPILIAAQEIIEIAYKKPHCSS